MYLQLIPNPAGTQKRKVKKNEWNSFLAVHGCIIDDVGKMIFWYEKRLLLNEEIKPKIHEYL